MFIPYNQFLTTMLSSESAKEPLALQICNDNTENLQVTQQYISKTKRFSIIIPAYNEEKRIEPSLREVCDYIESNSLPWYIVVSIDGNDGTENIVRNMEGEYPFLNHLKGNGRNGKGGAIKRALDIAAGDYIILMDADGAISFNEITKHLDLLNKYDFINFDRYRYKQNKIPRLRRFVSRGYNLFIRMLLSLNINDTQFGYKIMKTNDAKKIFKKLTITNGFFYSPFFFYLKKMKIRTVEVPVEYKHSDGSKFGVASMILGGFISALAFRLRESPFWKYVPRDIVFLYYKKFRWL